MNPFSTHRPYWFLTGLLLVMNLGLIAYLVWPAPGEQVRSPEEREERLLRYFEGHLNLDEAQLAEFQVAWREFHLQSREADQQMRQLRHQFHEELTSPDRDEARLNSLTEELAIIARDRETRLIRHFDRLAAICRPEQVDALRQRFGAMIGPPGQGRGQRRGPVPPPGDLPPP